MLKNNYETIKNNLDEAFLDFIDYGESGPFSYEERKKILQITKNAAVRYIGLQADGIVDKNYYLQAKKKILILLYESYRDMEKYPNYDYIWDLTDGLRKGYAYDTYEKVKTWVNAVNEGLKLDLDKSVDVIKYCAVMNVSKLARNVTKTNHTLLRACVRPQKSKRQIPYVPCCGERLARQFLSYDPDIVICGNTRWYMERFLSSIGVSCQQTKVWEGEEKNKKGKSNINAYKYLINGKEVLLFDAYHPAAWAFKTTDESFKKIIRNNELK